MLSVKEQQSVAVRRRPDLDPVAIARSPRPRRRTPLAFVVLLWICVLSVIVGAELPGLGMAAAVGVGWLLLRFLPGLAEAPAAAAGPERLDLDGDRARQSRRDEQ